MERTWKFLKNNLNIVPKLVKNHFHYAVVLNPAGSGSNKIQDYNSKRKIGKQCKIKNNLKTVDIIFVTFVIVPMMIQWIPPILLLVSFLWPCYWHRVTPTQPRVINLININRDAPTMERLFFYFIYIYIFFVIFILELIARNIYSRNK